MSDEPERTEETLEQKIAREIGVATWGSLEPHAERGALFWVEGLQLSEVALAIARDEASRVEQWVLSGQLRRAEQHPLPGVAGYHFAIIQPFVLATPLMIPTPNVTD
jgi:hypothetical protein